MNFPLEASLLALALAAAIVLPICYFLTRRRVPKNSSRVVIRDTRDLG